MKHTPGKILIFILSSIYLYAQSNSLATFNLSSNKINPYLKEAVEIKFIATQNDHEDVMFFFLTPIESKEYKIVLLNKQEDDIAYHNKKTIFRYLLFPLKDGNIKVKFNFTIKVASDEAVAQVYRGSRDNVKWIETTNTIIKLKPLQLNVKKLKNDTELIGDFKLTSKLKNDSISTYQSANIRYYLEGIGYDNFTIEPINKINNVNIFLDITKHFNKATKDGYKIQREFNYALISKKDFTIKAVTIKCYSPKHDIYYTLKTKRYDIKVKNTDISNLVDTDEYPKNNDNFDTLKDFLIYLTIFLIGYLSGKIKIKYKKRKKHYDDIKQTQDAKELLYLIINKYQDKVDKRYCRVLEEMVYNKSKEKNFINIKKEIIKSLSF